MVGLRGISGFCCRKIGDTCEALVEIPGNSSQTSVSVVEEAPSPGSPE